MTQPRRRRNFEWIRCRQVAGCSRVIGLSLAAGVWLGGCADAYQRSADRDIYRLLHDRKAKALGYDPQAVADPVFSASGVNPAGKPRAAEDRPNRTSLPPGSGDPRNEAIENDPATAVPSRAYARLPVTPIPPSEPPAIDLPPEHPPAAPLGPFPGQTVDEKASLDPFAADMASRWIESRYRFGPPSPRKQPMQLDLFAALKYAVGNSRSYRSRMDDLYLAALDVTLERHLLSPRPFVKQSFEYTGGQRDSAYRSALTATTDVGVRQKLPYGGEVVAETLVSFVHALNDNVSNGETATVALSGSIPLLRGAGMVNLEGLISSERELIYQVRLFEEFRRQFAIDVSNAYFRLQASYQAVNNRRVNVTNSISLLERTRAIYGANLGAAGGGGRLKLSFLEVQRSEQQLLDAQNSLIDSQENYLNELDNFKLLIGMDAKEDLDLVPVALEVNVPDLDQRDLIAVANQYRLDLQTARDRIDDSRRQVAIANNGLLPDLSLTASGLLGNRADTAAKSLDSRNLTYSAGITLDLPIDRLTERNAYRRSLIGFYQAQRSFDELQDRVSADVRAAIRAIKSSQVSLAIQKRSIELANRRLENANLLLKRGDTNARDVVEAQTALIRAQDLFEQARADLQVQLLRFLKQVGTLRVDPESGAIGRALDRVQPVKPFNIERAAANEAARPG